MTYAEMFSKVKGMMMEADVSTVNEHLAYQFNVTGEAEGIFYAEFDMDKIREYRGREMMGNTFRKVGAYAELLNPAIHEPFIREGQE